MTTSFDATFGVVAGRPLAIARAIGRPLAVRRVLWPRRVRIGRVGALGVFVLTVPLLDVLFTAEFTSAAT